LKEVEGKWEGRGKWRGMVVKEGQGELEGVNEARSKQTLPTFIYF